MEHRITGHEVETFDERLRDEESVERVRMDRGKFGERSDMARLYVDDSEPLIVGQVDEEGVRCVREPQTPGERLQHQLPLRDDTDADADGGILQHISNALRHPILIPAEEPEQRV